MVRTMVVLVGTVFITLGFVVMFLRALFKTVEQFEHTSFLDEDWMENEHK
jgi:uncharacterized membrane protein